MRKWIKKVCKKSKKHMDQRTENRSVDNHRNVKCNDKQNLAPNNANSHDSVLYILLNPSRRFSPSPRLGPQTFQYMNQIC